MSSRARMRHAAGQTRRTEDRPRRSPASDSEAAFQAQVIEYARLNGWQLIYHPYNSERSEPGFPDLTMVRGAEIVFAELKSATGRVRPEQQAWWLGLTTVSQAVSESVEVVLHSVPNGVVATPVSARHGLPRVGAFIWRPADWSEIEEALRRRKP